ncbi:MAG: DUF2184 domain-containing protein [Deltaproteobacteria bacterium]|nr:DUF2184 domain-containing protein [Deltaproteobacteria bacterium]
MCADLFKLERAIITGSKGIEMPDTCALSPSQYAFADTMRLSNTETSASSTSSRSPWASRTSSSGTRWRRPERRSRPGLAHRQPHQGAQALMPLQFNQSAPEARNLSFVITCDGRSGGVIFRYPGSARYMDGC